MKILIASLFLINIVFAQNYSKNEIEKLIANMVVLGFNGTSIDKNSQIYKDIKAGLGGVILFDKDPNDKTKAKNIQNLEQVKKLNKSLQEAGNSRLLISIDQEGGIVQRLKSDIGFVNTLSAKEIAQNGEAFARVSYKNMAKGLKELGFNLNFAPSVDVSVNKENSVIVKRGRSYSENSNEVIKYSSIFVDELKKEGVFSSLKHFPGHGSSKADSHFGFVDITNSWTKNELEPYRYFIKNKKADIIMSAHVFNKNLDKEYPATLSYSINTKLLREELGFDGVLITDDLQMSAITKHYDLKTTLKLAINSGVNLLLFANQLAKPLSLKEIVDTVYQEILNENISLEKIIESNKKVEKLKSKL